MTTTHAHVFTIGHSTHTLDELVAMLKAHNVATLVDVRTVPRSRRHPHFNADALSSSLPPLGVRYVQMGKPLGGLRHPKKGATTNLAWQNESFRGYADHMQSPEFRAAVDELIAMSSTSTGGIAVMCAEAVPWKCHRSLLSDALVARGVAVDHIMSPPKAQPHKVTAFARVDGDVVTYPALL